MGFDRLWPSPLPLLSSWATAEVARSEENGVKSVCDLLQFSIGRPGLRWSLWPREFLTTNCILLWICLQKVVLYSFFPISSLVKSLVVLICLVSCLSIFLEWECIGALPASTLLHICQDKESCLRCVMK